MEEVCAELEIDTQYAADLLKQAQQPLSLDVDDDDGERLNQIVVADDDILPPGKVDGRILKEMIKESLQNLPPRTRRVLEMRYGLKNGKTYTLEQVGKKIGVTRERARQIETQGLHSLRHPTYTRALKSFL